jgi:hypothetical protein
LHTRMSRHAGLDGSSPGRKHPYMINRELDVEVNGLLSPEHAVLRVMPGTLIPQKGLKCGNPVGLDSQRGASRTNCRPPAR